MAAEIGVSTSRALLRSTSAEAVDISTLPLTAAMAARMSMTAEPIKGLSADVMRDSARTLDVVTSNDAPLNCGRCICRPLANDASKFPRLNFEFAPGAPEMALSPRVQIVAQSIT